MNTSSIAEIRHHLVEELGALQQAAATANEVEGHACADDNEYASRLADASLNNSLNRHFRARIRDIEGALKRLDTDDFGLCEECGEEIGTARLMANPVARYCVVCQSELESGHVAFAS